MLSNLALAGLLLTTSVVSAVLALSIVACFFQPTLARSKLIPLGEEPERAVLLFEGRDLLDATGPARRLLRDAPSGETDWDRMLSALAPHFAALDERLDELSDSGETEVQGTGSAPFTLRAVQWNGVTRIEILDPEAEGWGVVVDGLSNRATEVELSLLRSAVTHSPTLTWRSASDGSIDWANRAYLQRVADHAGVSIGQLSWPLSTLFPSPTGSAPSGSWRHRVASQDTTRNQWYEVRSVETPEGTLNFATAIDATVRAESALREFVQTLTKTFAQLPIGLAIFDRQRQLALFNPALIDLTRLNPETLSARPTLFSFLDTLREARMIPEPKDYHSWRQMMTDLEAAAASGLYEETWTLPGGQTYRVTGRPHPDGAVAFLFEDISADISLTRRFRSEIEMGQAVIDKIDDAIAVFSQAGQVVLSNTCYASMWGSDPQSTLGVMSISDAVRHWESRSRSSDVWETVRDFVTDILPRADIVTEAELTNGTRILCRLSRLNGGGTMVRFRWAERTPRRADSRLNLSSPDKVLPA